MVITRFRFSPTLALKLNRMLLEMNRTVHRFLQTDVGAKICPTVVILASASSEPNHSESQHRQKTARRIRWTRLVASLLCLVTISGCSSGWFARDGKERKGPFSWMSTVVLPKGESFYSDRSRDIEKSLEMNHDRGM